MKFEKTDQVFLKTALEEAVESAKQNGGPFGAVLVLEGRIIARGHNTVTREHDPTAHAEVNVIRKASSELGTHDLRGAVLYASCEPCPMCMAASYWAHIAKIVFAATRRDAARAGFLDEDIYHELMLPVRKRKIAHVHLPVQGYETPFTTWANNLNKTPY